MGSRLRQDVKHFFECFCEVVGPKDENGPWIIQKFPESYKDDSVLKSVPEFAFPCEFNTSVPQHYSFVLTNSDSKWTYGFCRHDPRSETALVVLTYLPWHDIFNKFLDDVSELMQGTYNDHLWEFLDLVYQSKIPSTGNNLTVQLRPNMKVFTYEAPTQFKLPSIPENRNLTNYYNAVDNHNMMVIFASMLYERRIIFTSKKLSRLSACVQSANALLYPMSWQHIFIPVLPQSLMDCLLAPMPYLIGLPHSLVQNIRRNDLGDVVMLDADNNKVYTPFNDLESLPSDVVRSLQKHLRNHSTLLGDGISRAFLRALVQLIGGYRDALKISQGKEITFDREAFVDSRPSSIRPFLKQMLETQIFRQFIDERLALLNAGLGFSDEFEVEVCNYSDKSSSKLQQYKEWLHTGSSFLKNFKMKANPAVKSAVNSVKAQGKNVRAVCKEFGSKLKDRKGKPNSAPASPTSRRAHLSVLESKFNSSSTNADRSQFHLLEGGVQTASQSIEDLPSLNIDLMDDLKDVIFRNYHTRSNENDNTAVLQHYKLPADEKTTNDHLNRSTICFQSLSSSKSCGVDDTDSVFKLPQKVLPPSRSEAALVEPADLIRLDSSSSFGDFDPLTNGESLRTSSSDSGSGDILPTTTGVTNPLYFYDDDYKRQKLQNDFESLKDYCLKFDKLNFTQNSVHGSAATVAKSKSEWTKFE